ncbi:MAG: transporter substrate-binding domain-containing protein [Chloroflexi bacterium]|nr:transporter substrate-binding domain-containing protein [Chloroflexota bacterium]
MKRSIRLTAVLAVLALTTGACATSGGGTSPAASAASAGASVEPSVAASSEASAAASESAGSSASAAPSESGAASPSSALASMDPDSLLGKVVSSGKIRISTDPNYKPFSFLNPDGTYEGFDNATAVEAVKRLSDKIGAPVEIQWETPGWDLITAGSWGGRWDISIGSMSVTEGRAKVVDFADPYYFDSGAVAVPKDSAIQTLAELDGGKTFCVGTATTYEQWLTGTLEIVDPNVQTAPTEPDVTALPTDNECVQAVASGRTFDAIVANANGLADAVKSGAPIRVLEGPPIFTVSVAFALDKSGPSTTEMLAVLNEVVGEMHADGTLSKLSMEHLDKDVTQKPS